MRTTRPLFSCALIALAATLLAPGSLRAQTGAASITGIVSDQSGAAVPGATVTATNDATGVTYTAVSNEAGNYTVTSLPVGRT
jgi:Carboxypeptidase regulatory-like domain